ncbi:MAG: GNAT family N-acetyltransferase [Nocardioidaceae bacterium]
MGRRVAALTLDNVGDLPLPCRNCVSWELGTPGSDPTGKADWLSAVLLDWGSCGRIVYVDGDVAGFAIYAPPEYVERMGMAATSAISSDAVLLMTARVLPAHGAVGIGRVLIQSVVKDLLRRRGVKAIEAFGDVQGHDQACVVPARFLTAVGFKTVQAHPRYPRMRLDLGNVVTWRDDVEVAIDRWLSAIRRDKAVSPAGLHARTEPTHDTSPANGGPASVQARP